MPKFRRDTEWDWDAMPIHPATRRYESSRTIKATSTGLPNLSSQALTAFRAGTAKTIKPISNTAANAWWFFPVPSQVKGTGKGGVSASSNKGERQIKAGKTGSQSGKGLLVAKSVPIEARILAAGSRLAQDVLLAWQNETRPSHISPKDYVRTRFARSGWHEGETEQAYQLAEVLAAQADVSPDDVQKLNDYAAMLAEYNLLKQRESELQREISNRSGDTSEVVRALTILQKDLAFLESQFSAEGAVDDYRAAIKAVYGITIDDDGFDDLLDPNTHREGEPLPNDPIMSLMVLEYYRQGADMLSEFLVNTYFDDPENHDRYSFFQAVMGNITIRRSKDTVFAIGKDGKLKNIEEVKGFSQGSIINDLFNTFPTPMSADNFVHEIGHSFNAFSGKGGQGVGSFFGIPGFYDLAAEALKGLHVENPSPDSTEVFANLIAAVARGDIPDFVTTHKAEFRAAIRNAISFNSPEVYQQEFGMNQGGSISGNGLVNIRLQPSSSSDEGKKAYPQGSSIIALGKSPPGSDGYIWVYVAIHDQGGTVYGWIREDVVSGINLSALNEIDPQYTDPTVFDETNPFNPFR